MQESNQIFEETFRKRERGRVEGNKEVYVKLMESILVGNKEEENYGRFELGKFGALGCKE